MRLIDVDELAKHDHWNNVVKELSCAPTVDPIRHGKWLLLAEKGSCMDFHVKAQCSECGHEWFGKNGVGNYSYVFSAFICGTDEDATDFILRTARQMQIDNYCSNCGAKMDL